jgi:hypothetical protein
VPNDPEDKAADFDAQGGSVRPGGQAEGGVTPRPGDVASPAQASAGDANARKEMRRAGFGDDKGGDIS